MDLQLSRQSINLNKQMMDEKAEYAIDCEFTLPDYCPDIERILKCIVTPFISNISESSSSIDIEGTAKINVIYSTANNQIFGYEVSVSISKSFENRQHIENLFTVCNVKTNYINTRAVNSRKVDVHGSLGMVLVASMPQRVDFVSEAANESTVLRNKAMPVSELAGFNSKCFAINEVIEIPQSNGSLQNLVRYDFDAEFEDCQFVAGKAIVKGTITTNILYANTEGDCETLKVSIPTNQIVEVEGATEDSKAKVMLDIADVDLKPFTNSDGECRSINTSLKLRISVCAFNETMVNVATDAYSTECELSLNRTPINIERYETDVNLQHTAREKIELPTENLARIIDVKTCIKSCNSTSVNDKLVVKGEISALVTGISGNGECVFTEKNFEFEHASDINYTSNCNAQIRASIRNCSYNIVSASEVELRVDICIQGCVMSVRSTQVLDNIVADETKLKDNSNAPVLVVYFADKGESIWDIAVRYNTSIEMICEINDLNCESIPESRMILIPSM